MTLTTKRQDGSVVVRLKDGSDVTLRFDINTMCLAQEKGIDLQGIKGDGAAAGNFTVIRQMIWVMALEDQPEMTLTEAGRLVAMMPGTFQENIDTIMSVIAHLSAQDLVEDGEEGSAGSEEPTDPN